MSPVLLRLLGDESSLRRRLIRSGTGSAATHALNRVIALASGIVMARALTTSGYGIYAYAFAIMSVLTIVAEAGMPLMVMRDVASESTRQGWGRIRGVLRRSTEVVLISSLLLSIAGYLLLWYFSDGDWTGEQTQTIAIMLCLLPVGAYFKTIVGAIKGLHRVGIAQVFEKLAQPGLFVGAIAVVFALQPELRSPQVAMAIQVLSFAVILLVALITLKRLLPQDFRAHEASMPDSRWLSSAVSFTLIGGAALINNQADILMLGYLRTVDEVGIYRVTSQSAIFVGFLLQAATAVAAPHFASLHADGDNTRIRLLLNRIALIVTLGSLPIVLIFAFAGGPILGFVFGDAYSAGATVLLILSIGYLVNSSFGPVGMLLQMIGRERETSRLLWYTAGLNILLNAVLIPRLGSIGAALSTAFCISLYHFLLRRVVNATVPR